jgi:hypothetical protein
MATRFQKIKDFNMARGLISKGFNINTELAMLKEELDELEYSSPKLVWWKQWFVPRQLSGENDRVDALCDIIVLATGALYKLGYDADKAMDETLKEITSRTGKLNVQTGKWEKFTYPEAQRKWKQANYSKAKLGHEN